MFFLLSMISLPLFGQFMEVMGAAGGGGQGGAGDPFEGPSREHQLGEVPGDGRQRSSRISG